MEQPHTERARVDDALRRHIIVLVGLMGAGKTSVGKRLAAALDLPFRDADDEIVAAAGLTIPEIFELYGEERFRDGERRVMQRLMSGEPCILATGGGAFMDPLTRMTVQQQGISVWLKADIDVLVRRVARKDTRPLLSGKDPREVLHRLAAVREPVYALADIVVESGERAHTATVDAIIEGLRQRLIKDTDMTTVPVALAGRAYDVRIGEGLIGRAGELAAPFLKHKRIAVVADETVFKLHGEALIAAFTAAGIEAPVITVPSGEASKSFAELERICDRLLALELDRGDLVAAFGGGVVGDLAGFAASIYKRGIDFVQIPTTLLAQVDSSVGGKTAIDTPRGKNLIGAFHQPRLVLADLDVLSTLSDREMRAGYAEVVKYGLLGDVAFLAWLEENAAAVLARDRIALTYAVARCVAMKAEIVAEDEREAGRRALLNLGHTFGHALEAEIGFGDTLLHGEAVALGSAQAFRFSAMEGLCPQADADRAEAAIAMAGLPTRLSQIANGVTFSADRLIAHMGNDKKTEGGALTFILARGVGDAFVEKGVDPTALRRFLITEGATP